MTTKIHGVIRGHDNLLYDPKGHSDLCGRFDLVDDQKCHGVIRGCVTYIMIQTITVTSVVSLTKFMTPKGHGVIRGRRDQHYDSKDLCGQFDLVYDSKSSRTH